MKKYNKIVFFCLTKNRTELYNHGIEQNRVILTMNITLTIPVKEFGPLATAAALNGADLSTYTKQALTAALPEPAEQPTELTALAETPAAAPDPAPVVPLVSEDDALALL